MLLILLGCLTPVAAADLPAAGLTEVNVTKDWPDKAGWIGQKAVLLPAKLYQNVSFLFLYTQPSLAESGVDQLNHGRSLLGRSLVIKGLYERKTNAAKEYYWYLDSGKTGESLWVKDSKDRPLADQPFALESEISLEKSWLNQINTLAGHTVWYNRNSDASFGKSGSARHLAPLTVKEVRSEGPFSGNYQLILLKEDETALVWSVGLGSTPPVYNHKQFYDLLQQSFYTQNPFEAYPSWPEDRWTAVKARKVAVGMSQDMVSLSWGVAKQITKAKDGTEVWEYSGLRYLTFKDKTLTKIRIPKPQPPSEAKSKNDKDAKNQSGQDKGKDKNKNNSSLPELIEVTEAGPVEQTAPADKDKKAPADAPAGDQATDKEKKR